MAKYKHLQCNTVDLQSVKPQEILKFTNFPDYQKRIEGSKN